MNDSQWFNKEPSYFDCLLNNWKEEFQKSELYQKHVVNNFDINSLSNESHVKIKSNGLH